MTLWGISKKSGSVLGGQIPSYSGLKRSWGRPQDNDLQRSDNLLLTLGKPADYVERILLVTASYQRGLPLSEKTIAVRQQDARCSPATDTTRAAGTRSGFQPMRCADFSYLWGGARVFMHGSVWGKRLLVRGRSNLPSLKKARSPAPHPGFSCDEFANGIDCSFHPGIISKRTEGGKIVGYLVNEYFGYRPSKRSNISCGQTACPWCLPRNSRRR